MAQPTDGIGVYIQSVSKFSQLEVKMKSVFSIIITRRMLIFKLKSMMQ